MTAAAPFACKVGDGRPPKQGKWQHWQTGPTISMYIANPTLYTESNLDFLPSGDLLCEILQIPFSSSRGETSGVKGGDMTVNAELFHTFKLVGLVLVLNLSLIRSSY